MSHMCQVKEIVDISKALSKDLQDNMYTVVMMCMESHPTVGVSLIGMNLGVLKLW